MELDRIKFLRNQFWVYTNLGASQAVDIDAVIMLFLFCSKAFQSRCFNHTFVTTVICYYLFINCVVLKYKFNI